MIIVANFKANLTSDEVINWIDNFYQKQLANNFQGGIHVVVCPSFVSLPFTKDHLQQKKWNYKLYLGAQNLSSYANGSYTGEVTALMLRHLVRYVIIGHSERRRLFAETTESVNDKIKQALEVGITPIVCVSAIEEVKAIKSKFISLPGMFAFEPLTAIGSGNPESAKGVESFIKEIRKFYDTIDVLYGGSVTSENVRNYFKIPAVSGVLVGKASLDPSEFSTIIACATF